MNKEQMLLILFIEELNEVAQAATKALRFGMDEQRDLPTTNRYRLLEEWNDLLAVKSLLGGNGVISLSHDSGLIEKKLYKIEKYLDYSRELGTLKD